MFDLKGSILNRIQANCHQNSVMLDSDFKIWRNQEPIQLKKNDY